MKKRQLDNVSVRNKFWPINTVISMPLRLSSPFRNKHLWVFAAWNGQRYDDNSRYLYEYILKNRPEITAVWVTKSDDIYHQMKEQGLPVVHGNSAEGRKTMLKAGVAFYTNGIDDFSNICMLYGAVTVHLGHAAAAIKKTGTAVNNYHHFPLKKYLKYIKNKLFTYYHFTYVCASSELAAQSKISTYKAKAEQIIYTGMPRNDIFRNIDAINPKDVLGFEDADKYKYILYLPTYRLYPNTAVAGVAESVAADSDFIDLLEKNKYKILIKLHNVDSKIELKTCDALKVLKNEEVSSTQELLAISEMLISDYSSCVIDFAIKNSPNVLYAPDLNEYNEDNGIKDSWMEIYESDSTIKDPEGLKEVIKEFIITGKYDLSVNELLNRYSSANDAVSNCRKLTDILCQKLSVN